MHAQNNKQLKITRTILKKPKQYLIDRIGLRINAFSCKKFHLKTSFKRFNLIIFMEYFLTGFNDLLQNDFV